MALGTLGLLARSRLTRAVMNRPRLTAACVFLVVLLAMQGGAAAEHAVGLDPKGGHDMYTGP